MNDSTPNASPPGYDVIVIGAGAAGLLAAARSAERGRRTLLLEKNAKPGVKILMSGGTRCNLTHDCDERGIIAGFGSAGPFLHSPLAALGPRETVELFNAEGVPTKIEPETGKIFPLSDKALDVANALVRRLKRCGAELALGEGVDAVERDGESFVVHTAKRALRAPRLLITTGGKSYPGCGTVGDGYAWLAAWGHTIRKPRPALVPLVSEDPWVRELSGVTIPDTMLRVVDPQQGWQGSSGASSQGDAKKRSARRPNSLPPGVLIERRGSLLFTHTGLSGPVVLDVSRAVTGSPQPRNLRLVADFLPDVRAEALDEQLRSAAATDGRKQVLNLLPEAVPRRLAESLLTRVGVPLDRRASELPKDERSRVVQGIKRAEIQVTGSRGFDKAEVTAGGVALGEVDSRTMQSKLVPGLFLAGEILDLDGFIGGYNFQAAFSTGWLAAENL